MFAVVALGKQMQEDPKLEAILVHSTFREPVQSGLKTENLSKKRSSALQLFQHFQGLFTEDQMLRVKESLRGNRSVKPSEMLCTVRSWPHYLISRHGGQCCLTRQHGSR